jgi:gas vesicle protein
MAEDNSGSGILWFVAGVAIGASVALLYAPASGAETRSQIAKKTGEGRAALAGSGKDMLERGKELFERGRQLADEAAEMFERGRKLVDSAAENVEKG